MTNARSLSPKIHSLHTAFEEHDIDFALITESWLKDGTVLDRDIIDLEWGTDLKIVYKNRPRTAAGRRKVGGGVSIIYSKSRCNLRERKIGGNKFELVLAVGKVGSIPRQVAVLCIYLQPRMKADELAEICEIISREILMLKAKGDPLFFIGGDMNRKSLEAALADFPDIVQCNFEPTRGDACLDIMFSNAPCLLPSNWPPLETREGVRSDHLCVVFSGKIDRERDFIWTKKTVRKHTSEALLTYGERLRHNDWDTLLPPNLTADEMIERFQKWNMDLTDELFPLKTVRCRSNEAPWVTEGIRRVSKQKKRVYKRGGKSALWRHLDARMSLMLEDTKLAFVDKMSESGTSTKKYFSAVKALGTASKGKDWSITDLFPGRTEAEAGEEAAGYFTRITDLFEPLQDQPPRPEDRRRPVTKEEVAKKLKAAKKPNSSVEGDLLPRVVKAHHGWLVDPVTRIYNAIFSEGTWPRAWKTETTVVIPKVPNPDSLADCRNISCTPFLSKVLESILLEDLRSEIPDDEVQYGGLKGSSVDHLLVDLFETVLRPLESGCPSLVLGIDFEKAFNRLDHNECLGQLAALGASNPSLSLTRSFLTGRSMRVKVGNGLSNRRALSGGSPQDSILGCYLYCAATQRLNRSLPYVPTNTAAPEDDVDRSPAAPVGDDRDEAPQGFDLMPPDAESWDEGASQGTSPGNSHNSSSSFLTAEDPENREDSPLGSFKYIDDTTVTETVDIENCIRHITATNPTELIPALHLGPFFAALIVAAEAIGMRINCKKTQLLCFSPDNGYLAWSKLRGDDGDILSNSVMKLLGYVLGTGPGATDQVDLIKKKFRAKFWTLIHLRRAGIAGQKLFKLYAAMIRPTLETNCVIFHPMLNKGQAAELERLQKQAVKLCFGWNSPYEEICVMNNIDSLAQRRERRIRRFVSKAMMNRKFASRWFVRRPEIENDLRNRRPFVENKAKTERYKNRPLVYMQKIANDLCTNAYHN